MPVTLAQAQQNAATDLDVSVINEFRQASWLMDNITFDDVVNPVGGGGTLTYGYRRQITRRGASFRAINAEYTPVEVTTQQFTVDLKPLGGAFQIDRVLARVGPAASGEVALQMGELIYATRATFGEAAILGDTRVDANGFDGLDKALRGSVTEYNADGQVDLTAVTDKASALTFLAQVDEWLGSMDGAPSAILLNRWLKGRIKLAALWADFYTRSEDAFGRPIDAYNGVPLIDLGDAAASGNPIIPIHDDRDPTDSVWTVQVTGSPTGGTFTLTVTAPTGGAVTTDPIAFNANNAAYKAALEALSNVADGDVTVTGAGTKTVKFEGSLEDAVVTVALANNSLTGGSTPTVAVNAVSPSGAVTGLTDMYAVRLAMDGFHAVSMTGPLVATWLPDFTKPGAVKTGEVELGPAAVALKKTKAAGVFRNIKVR